MSELAPSVGSTIRVPLPADAAKRTMDVAGALLALVLLSPLLVVVALAVLVSSGAPVLYRQERAGRDGRSFEVWKFRTMRVGADAQLQLVRHLDETGAGPLFKARHDPRVTPVGRWLRRCSLDELPQLVNVLQGSMSLVGPRPALLHEVATYTETERRRLSVQPGITGLWQVNGRSGLGWDDGVGLDLHYVEHRSLRLDLWILLRTVPAVLLARGAF